MFKKVIVFVCLLVTQHLKEAMGNKWVPQRYFFSSGPYILADLHITTLNISYSKLDLLDLLNIKIHQMTC
jgi:hypothetical protein